MLRSNRFLAVAMLVAGACAAQAADIQATDPYVRAVPPGQPNSAAFMSLSNRGGELRALVGAASDASEVAELHTHVMSDGMMRMRRIEKIDLPAGETVALEPGGLHIMLIGLKRELKPGDEVRLTLSFDDGEKVAVSAPVRKIDMSQMKHH